LGFWFESKPSGNPGCSDLTFHWLRHADEYCRIE
jgi:hypothetical protein